MTHTPLTEQQLDKYADRALREFLTAHPSETEMAASLARDGFGPDEITNMLSRQPRPASSPQAAASEETNR